MSPLQLQYHNLNLNFVKQIKIKLTILFMASLAWLAAVDTSSNASENIKNEKLMKRTK